jgi:hypothetical protein
MTNFFISLIRTWVPIGIGAVLSWLAVNYGVVVDEDIKAQLAVGLTGVLIALYYGIVHLLEQKFPQIGWFLGLATRPQYHRAKDANPMVLHEGATKAELKAPRPSYDPNEI